MSAKIHRNSLKPGHKIHWYEIRDILGQGGFGITYLAFDPNLEKFVAIKEYLPIELAVREGDASVHPVSENHSEHYSWGLDRFITEARTLSKFKHPNIVHVLSVTEENNTAYMVMEYEEGESLQDKLAGKKTLDETEIMKILIPILGGLEVIHAAGFIHRDIKPGNIFIRKDGSPVLLDFGSARHALGEETKTLTTLVSPGYAPFEQYFSKSDEQGQWTDIYSLGATLYRAVTGMTPHDAVDRSNAILKTSKDTNVPAIEIARDNYSERLLAAIDHAIAFRIEDRPQTIAEWRDTLDIETISEPTAIEPPPVVDPNAETVAGTEVLDAIEQAKKKPGCLKRIFKTVAIVFGVLLLLAILFGEDKKQQEATPEQTEPSTVVPPPAESPTDIQEQQPPVEAEPVQEEPEPIPEPEPPESKIESLLTAAKEDIEARRLSKPAGNNAYEKLKQVLAEDPDNQQAKEGMRRIAQAYAGMARQSAQNGKYREAIGHLQTLKKLFPDNKQINDKIKQLRQAAKEQRKQN